MSNTNYPVSNATDKGQRLTSLLLRIKTDWNDLQSERLAMIQKQDLAGNSGVKNVTGAVTSSGLVKLTVTAHGYATNDQVCVKNIGGTIEANGPWIITVVDANSFTLQNSVFSTTYTSGGTVQKSTVFAVVGQDYFLGADANEKSANANRGFAEIDSAYSIADAAIRQAIARLL